MFLTHHFARPETLRRARYWLQQFGVAPHEVSADGRGLPRLTVHGSLADVRKARTIIDTIESADPDGWPGVWELARMPHPAAPPAEPPAHPTAEPHRSGTVIGWHPDVFDEILADPDIRAMCEAFGRS